MDHVPTPFKNIQAMTQFYSALDFLPIYVVKLDLELNITWANRFAKDLDEGLLNHRCYRNFNPDMEQCTFCPVVRSIASKQTEISLIEVVDEHDKIYEVTAIPSFDDDEQLDGVFEVRRDVTVLINHQKIKHEPKSKKAKEELFSSDDLLDIVSNELRQHSDNVVKLHTRLGSGKLSQDQKISYAGMKTSMVKMSNIMNNISTMRNINKGVIKSTKKKANLKDLIIEKFDYYRSKSDFNGNNFDYKYDSSIPSKLVFDKTKVDLILSNLIDYGMTHTSNRYINLLTTLIDETNEIVKLNIKLKNVGSIAIHDVVEKDVDNYIRNNLALSVMKNLVMSLDGSFKMMPVSGYGVDIEINISLKKPFTASKLPMFNRITQELRNKKEKRLMPENTGRKKILVAEDEPIGRITLEQMLKNDFDVIFAKNGKIAVEKYFSEQPDLVIMDIMMPIMNGFDAFDQIERNSITRVPIIACTAKVIKSEKEYLKSYGFDDYISKPVSLKTLREMINRHISKG